MITKYSEFCLLCGKPHPEVHHLVFGNSKRRLADQDELTIPVCKFHHEMMHNHQAMQVMSHICGQLFYERNLCASGVSPDDARESFRKRYGVSYM